MDSSNYLSSAKKQFLYYKLLGDQSFNQLSDKELFWSTDQEMNSIAVIVKHLWGNMLSRWTNFLSEDGEKEWRQRDAEFEPSISSREELVEKWEKGWRCLFLALDGLNANNIDQTIYIRNQGHSIPEAVNRQMCHYAYHIGQIVLIARMIKGKEWKSLSIPKGASKEYNKEKFSIEKKDGHFTDEYIA